MTKPESDATDSGHDEQSVDTEQGVTASFSPEEAGAWVLARLNEAVQTLPAPTTPQAPRRALSRRSRDKAPSARVASARATRDEASNKPDDETDLAAWKEDLWHSVHVQIRQHSLHNVGFIASPRHPIQLRGSRPPHNGFLYEPVGTRECAVPSELIWNHDRFTKEVGRSFTYYLLARRLFPHEDELPPQVPLPVEILTARPRFTPLPYVQALLPSAPDLTLLQREVAHVATLASPPLYQEWQEAQEYIDDHLTPPFALRREMALFGVLAPHEEAYYGMWIMLGKWHEYRCQCDRLPIAVEDA